MFGPAGGVVFAVMVAFSCFGALNGQYIVSFAAQVGLSSLTLSCAGSSFTSARLIYVAGKEGYLPALFGRHNATLKTPLNAMCLQAGLTIAFIMIGGGFRSLINFAVVASWAFYFLTVSETPATYDSNMSLKGGWGSRSLVWSSCVSRSLCWNDHTRHGSLRPSFSAQYV